MEEMDVFKINNDDDNVVHNMCIQVSLLWKQSLLVLISNLARVGISYFQKLAKRSKIR